MTSTTTLLWSLIRCLTIASIAVWPVAAVVSHIDASSSVPSRRWRFLLAVFPFFVPELLIGFNYRLTVTQMTSGASPLIASICTEALYGLLMLSRCLAVGVAISLLLPQRRATKESMYSWLLLRDSMSASAWWYGWLTLKVFGEWQASLVGWSVMALMTFQEFETAALMQIDQHPIAWSVWLFDAHAARLSLWSSLQIMIVPLLCELLMLCPAWCVLAHRPAAGADGPSFDHALNGRASVWKSATFSALLTPGIVLFALWPLLNNALPILRGVMLMQENSALRQSCVQILTSTGFAIGATVLSMGAAFRFCNAIMAAPAPAGTILNRIFWWILLLPGLLGSLVLSLSLLAMFQLPVLRQLYDTWLPMLLGQTLAVLPFSVVIVLLLIRLSDPTSLHSTRLLAASADPRVCRDMAAIRWRLTTVRWLLGGLIIAHRCFWDVTVASILRPVQVEPVITRLYNEMHYGRTEALMSLSLLAAMTPLVIAAAAMLLSRLVTIFWRSSRGHD